MLKIPFSLKTKSKTDNSDKEIWLKIEDFDTKDSQQMTDEWRLMTDKSQLLRNTEDWQLITLTLRTSDDHWLQTNEYWQLKTG